MRIKEKMGLVYTGLFLAIGLAVLSQNTEVLMSAYRGETRVKPVDDVINVRAGVDQRLFVLQNDLRPEFLSPGVVRLLSQPACGTVAQEGTSLTYVNSQSCRGHQVFAYCLFNGVECRSAKVALRLLEPREAVASIKAGPMTGTDDQSPQLAINKSDLEISNVHLGKTTTERPKGLSKGAKLAAVAVERQADFIRPGMLSEDLALDVQVLTDVPGGFGAHLKDVADLTAEADTAIDGIARDAIGVVVLPIAPDIALRARPIKGLPVVNLARFDDGFAAPSIDALVDSSPFGTACPTNLEAEVMPSAMVELRLNAPCQPNSRVQVRHGKVSFTMQTGHTGTLVMQVPAFEIRATFQVRLQDGQRLAAAVSVPELENFERIAIQWTGSFNLDLHALEFSAEPGGSGHVFATDEGSVSGRPAHSQGFLTSLGDSRVEQPSMTEVYSLPTGPNTKSGVVEMIVSASGGATTCGTQQALRSFLSKSGRLVVASGFAFKMPDCGDETRSIVLKNAVRDLIIASN